VLRAVDRFDGGPAYAAAMALGAYCYAALRPVELGKAVCRADVAETKSPLARALHLLLLALLGLLAFRHFSLP